MVELQLLNEPDMSTNSMAGLNNPCAAMYFIFKLNITDVDCEKRRVENRMKNTVEKRKRESEVLDFIMKWS